MSKNKQTSNERRQFERLEFVSSVQLFSGTEAWTCQIIDISLKGVLFTKPHKWPGKQHDIYRLSISLTNSPSISMSIEIAHIDKSTIGAKWNKIDVGSFSRLKRLLELNTIDRNRISKEISFL
jgi:HEPN domain-containing protein